MKRRREPDSIFRQTAAHGVRLLSLFLAVVSAGFCLPLQTEFQEPWKEPTKAIVLDPYQSNAIDWEQVATDTRVVAIIHRATVGLSKVDKRYNERKSEALTRGYKWGSYHLGKNSDPIKQADFYLATVSPGEDEVLALDIESFDPASANFMSIDKARSFIKRIKEKTGRYPLVYGNHAVIKAISNKAGTDGVFSNTPLWYARFRKTVPDFPQGTWKSYTLWQFSSEINCAKETESNCLYRVPGTLTDMDVNVFNGTVDELKAKWPFK